VDQAALDAAIELGLDHGGWCPRGRLSEAGPIPTRFRLRETDSAEYWVRTEQNVVDSDATLILFQQEIRGGTALTERMAAKHGRPCRCVDLSHSPAVEPVREWLRQQRVAVLNVAGPRESSCPGIQDQARRFLLDVFREKESSVE
jgi:hypothetical protein